MLRTNRLSKQNGARGPFATETESEESARCEQLLEVLRETGKETEDCEPEDRDLKGSDAADAIGEVSTEPAADGGHQQCCGTENTRLCARDSPNGDQRGNDEAVDLDVHRVQRPAADACSERSPFRRRKSLQPFEHTRALGCGCVDGFRCHWGPKFLAR